VRPLERPARAGVARELQAREAAVRELQARVLQARARAALWTPALRARPLPTAARVRSVAFRSPKDAPRRDSAFRSPESPVRPSHSGARAMARWSTSRATGCPADTKRSHSSTMGPARPTWATAVDRKPARVAQPVTISIPARSAAEGWVRRATIRHRLAPRRSPAAPAATTLRRVAACLKPASPANGDARARSRVVTASGTLVHGSCLSWVLRRPVPGPSAKLARPLRALALESLKGLAEFRRRGDESGDGPASSRGRADQSRGRAHASRGDAHPLLGRANESREALRPSGRLTGPFVQWRFENDRDVVTSSGRVCPLARWAHESRGLAGEKA
jgi:hypothetical protein